MDDNTKKKQALKVDFSNDVNPDPEQEGEIPDPFNMEDKRVKKWILIGHMLGVSHPLDGKFHEAFIKLQFILPRQIHGNPVLCSNYTALVTQFNSTSSTASKSIPMMSTLTRIDMKEKIPQKEVLNHKHKAPGTGSQARNGPN
jgi:hypothetical protein